jgi:RHS repeat-associated protein
MKMAKYYCRVLSFCLIINLSLLNIANAQQKQGFTYDKNGNLVSDGHTTYTWDYANRMSQASTTSKVLTYAYDHAGQRTKYATGATTTYSVNKFFDKTNSIPTERIYIGNQLISIVTNTGASADLKYVHTDHLGSTQVVTAVTDTIKEVSDHYPYGAIRFDTTNGHNERNKFTGYEYDADTTLSYAGARYQDGRVGRFVSQDPVFHSVGNNNELKGRTKLDLASYLTDPQGLNSYSYVRNNPLKMVDQNGEWYKEFFWDNIRTLGNGQSWNSFQGELGQAANQLSQDSAVWDAAISHPVAAGATIGVGSGVAFAGASVGLTTLSTQYLGGLGTGCIALCNKAMESTRIIADYSSTYGNTVGSKMNDVSKYFAENGVNATEHAVFRTVTREGRGITPQAVVDTYNTGAKYFDTLHNNLTYFKDGVRIGVDNAGTIRTVVTQGAINNLQRFIPIK